MKIANVNCLSLLIVLILAISACNDHNNTTTEIAPSNNRLHTFNWLLGEWQQQTSEGISTESWTRVNDSLFTGISYYIIGNDTVSYEEIRLEQQNDQIRYIPSVKNQNDDQPVVFTMQKMDEGSVVFENQAHDFPQLISYRQINQDSMVAEISGMVNEKEKKISFPMHRIK